MQVLVQVAELIQCSATLLRVRRSRGGTPRRRCGRFESEGSPKPLLEPCVSGGFLGLIWPEKMESCEVESVVPW